MYEIITPNNVANRHASGLSIAKVFIEMDPRINKFLTSNLIHNKSFINERAVKNVALAGPDFCRVIIQVIDREKQIIAKTAKDVCDAIDKWAGYSNVTGARGGRLAIVSQVDILDDEFEAVMAPDGTPILYFEAWLSTAVIYNHRRATLNHCKDACEFGEDARNLFEKILDIEDSVDIAVEHQYFGIYEHGNIKF
jgi:hypothetical protein